MKRPWTRGEKWLFAAPLLLILAAVGFAVGPNAVRNSLGYPRELAATPSNVLTSISLSSDGKVLVAGEYTRRPTKLRLNTIYAWDARTFQPLPALTRPLTLRDGTTYCVSLSPDASTLAWSGFGTRFTAMDFSTRRVLWTRGWRSTSRDAAFSPDGKLVALQISSSMGIFAARTGKKVAGWNLLPEGSEGAFQFSPRGHYFASTGGRKHFAGWGKSPNNSGGNLEVRDTSNWKLERVLSLPNTDKIAFSPDERSIIGIAWLRKPENSIENIGSILRCFDTRIGQVKWQLDSRDKSIDARLRFLYDACFSPDGATVAVLASGQPLLLLDASSGAVKSTLRVPANQQSNSLLPHGLAFSPDGKRLFARGQSAVLVWNLP